MASMLYPLSGVDASVSGGEHLMGPVDAEEDGEGDGEGEAAALQQRIR